METLSIRDLRERTGGLVGQAKLGRLSLVAKHGRPIFVALPLDEHLLEEGVAVAVDYPAEELEEELTALMS